jgi:hypothetical protein
MALAMPLIEPIVTQVLRDETDARRKAAKGEERLRRVDTRHQINLDNSDIDFDKSSPKRKSIYGRLQQTGLVGSRDRQGGPFNPLRRSRSRERNLGECLWAGQGRPGRYNGCG